MIDRLMQRYPHPPTTRRSRPRGWPLAIGMLLVGLSVLPACERRNQAVDQIAEDSAAAQTETNSLTFENISLEQANEAGEPVWKIQAARAEYSANNQTANVMAPKGDLIQDGAVIYKVEAATGEIHQNGEVIYLRGNVIAQDMRDGAMLKGDEMEWRPQEAILTIRNNLQGTHPQVNATAQSATVFTRDRRMELSGNVLATTTDPNTRLQAQQLIWYVPEERISSPAAIQVERYENQQIIDRATGNRAEVSLRERTIHLLDRATLSLREPPLQVVSDNLLWNVGSNLITATSPLEVINAQQQTRLTASQGRMDLEQEIVYLTGNVQVTAQRNNAQLNSDQLVWKVPTQDLEATGNVVYQQTNPVATLRGNRAVGQLANQTVVVSGGRVVTEVIPENQGN